ncbi:HWE histidine kinase domain-containing protein [Allorhizobium undicola]|uniref:PAS domain-containing sensor histidine kinase n=1 Tax=Allorhizobium undicola TaxID=78527 RepID=UPI003D332032
MQVKGGQITQFGRGRMGQLIASYDWASTPLGSIEGWSQSLRSYVEMMLGQKHAICLFWGPDLTLLYNDAYAPILGAKENTALGRPASLVWADVWEAITPFVNQALTGEGTWSQEMPLVMTRNGYPEETFWTFSYSPLYENGEIAGMINVALDATHGVMARRRQDELQHELVHRVKNSLAVTKAIVTSTLRNASSVQVAQEAIGNRMSALNRAQDLLFSVAEKALIADVVRTALEAHLDRPERVVMLGPALDVSANQALGLSLAVYELATNALKYGALSSPDGLVSIAWAVDSEDAFSFEWVESGGPAVEAPSSNGFGSRLTGRVVPAYFWGSAETDFAVSGLRYRLSGQLTQKA